MQTFTEDQFNFKTQMKVEKFILDRGKDLLIPNHQRSSLVNFSVDIVDRGQEFSKKDDELF